MPRDLTTEPITDREIAERLSWLYEHCAARGYPATAGAIYTAIQSAVLIDESQRRGRG